MTSKYIKFLIISFVTIISSTNMAYSYHIVTSLDFLCNNDNVCDWPETSSVCPSDCGTLSISKYTDQRSKYVDTEQNCQYNGNGLSNSCASSTGGSGRFNDLQSALNSLVAGDTLYVSPGDYWVSGGAFEFTAHGTETRPVIITAADTNNKPIVYSFDPQGGTSANNHPAITASGGEYIIFDNLEIRGLIGLWGNVDNSQIQNVDCSVGWGFCDGNWSCIRVEGTDTRNNVVHHNYVHDVAVPDFYTSCTNSRPAGLKGFEAQNTIWEFNTVNGMQWGYDHHRDGDEITLRFNEFQDVSGVGIRYGAAGNTYTYGNIVHGNTWFCIERLSGGHEDGSTDILYNNICSFTARTFNSQAVFNLEFYNNIMNSLMDSGDDPMQNNGVAPKVAGGTLYMDHNAYDSNAPYCYDPDSWGYGPTVDTLTAWRAIHSSQELHSHESSGGACTFVNAPTSENDMTYDFTPTDTFCTTGSSEGGMLGPYGLVDCIGYTCGDVEDSSPSPSDTTNPTINITSPTSAANYVTSMSTVTLAGSANDDVALSSIIWSCTSGCSGSGSGSGTSSWSVNNINLVEGSNTIRITAIDSSNNQATDTITVTYTSKPEAPTSLTIQ